VPNPKKNMSPINLVNDDDLRNIFKLHDYSKKLDIKVINNFDTSINQLTDQIIKKIKMRLKV